MKFYSFEEIRDRGSCVTYVEQILGITLKNGRCSASWRGGDGENVAVQRDKWFDHRTKEGGGIIELAAIAKHDGNIQLAQQALGEWLGLEPRKTAVKHTAGTSSKRYDELTAQGYNEVARYNYEDDAGELVHFVVRMEHAEKGKEFLQGTPDGWGLRDVVPILYRRREWAASDEVYIVEGEKDADTLARLNLPATTNCGGAEKWRPEYAHQFKDKRVIIVRDNDEAGLKHAQRVSAELKDSAAEVRIVCPSTAEKGDVTDWINSEGGSKKKLLELVKATDPIDLTALEAVDPVVEAAKQANKSDFANYVEVEVGEGPQKKMVKKARQINELIDEAFTRFCLFPRRIRGTNNVFDHDRESGQIVQIRTTSQFFSWMGRKSGRRIVWAPGDSFVTKPEMWEAVRDEAMEYESISLIPDWPRRLDVYYINPNLPDPSPGYKAFNGLVDFFNPASPGYRTLLKALIVAPIWFCPRIQRPGWVIDSQGGAGVGKTTLAEIIAVLYLCDPIRAKPNELKNKYDEIAKRLVSAAGRLSRIFLVDNVVGTFHSPNLAELITSMSVSGRAPYGHGEESRPNNLTYIITSNSASVDNDLADRCFFVELNRADRSSNWRQSLIAYIERYRMQIFADILHMLEHAPAIEKKPVTRFPEFEEAILRGVCADEAEFIAAMEAQQESRQAANIEEEHARTIEDEFSSRLSDCGRQPYSEMIFVRTDVIQKWMDDILPEIAVPTQYIRNLAKNGLTQRFEAKPERFPHNGKDRRRGIMWMPERHNGGAVRIVGITQNKITEIISKD